jgi:four helix bundle protein
MDDAIMKARTKAFALRIIRVVESLPNNRTCDILGRQMLRSGTSVGANYRASRRARSTAEFLAKLGIVEEEADETGYWMELLIESGHMKPSRLAPLRKECDELLAITVATIKSTKRSSRK